MPDPSPHPAGAAAPEPQQNAWDELGPEGLAKLADPYYRDQSIPGWGEHQPISFNRHTSCIKCCGPQKDGSSSQPSWPCRAALLAAHEELRSQIRSMDRRMAAQAERLAQEKAKYDGLAAGHAVVRLELDAARAALAQAEHQAAINLQGLQIQHKAAEDIRGWWAQAKRERDEARADLAAAVRRAEQFRGIIIQLGVRYCGLALWECRDCHATGRHRIDITHLDGCRIGPAALGLAGAEGESVPDHQRPWTDAQRPWTHSPMEEH